MISIIAHSRNINSDLEDARTKIPSNLQAKALSLSEPLTVIYFQDLSSDPEPCPNNPALFPGSLIEYAVILFKKQKQCKHQNSASAHLARAASVHASHAHNSISAAANENNNNMGGSESTGNLVRYLVPDSKRVFFYLVS